jgi:uncharacterized repeat protein (TIGR01451 family)
MRRHFALCAALGAIAVFGLVGAAGATAGPVWNLDLQHNETNFPPGGTAEYWIDLANVGDAPTTGPVTLTVDLPPGLSRNSVRTSFDYVYYPEVGWSCPGSVGDRTIVCTTTGVFGRHTTNRELILSVDVDSPPGGEADLLTSATVQGGAAAETSAVEPTHVSAQPAGFGVVADSFVPDFFKADGIDTEREAGARHDLLTIPFDLNSIAFPLPEAPSQKLADESIRDLEIDLPPGFIANANAAGECAAADFTFGKCPPSTQVGRIDLRTFPILAPYPEQSFGDITTGIFNLSHPRGAIGDLAFAIAGNAVHLNASLDPGNHYAIRIRVPDINEIRPVFAQRLTLWGVPADSSHDSERCPGFTNGFLTGLGGSTEKECSTDAARRPFLALPSQCEFDNTFRLLHYDSWQNRGAFGPEIDYTMPGKITDCNRPRFEPDVEVIPTGKQANTPTGLDVHVKIAQNENPDALATPPVKRFTVTLPKGMSFSPSFADGLQSCTLAQMKLGTNEPVGCPDAARIGEVTLHSPLLPRAAEGSMYLAAQGDNPFGSLFALYLVLHDTEERGVLVKIPGRIDVDPVSGQIVTTFRDTPQFPFDDLTLKFRSGPRAPLISPPSCGTQTIGVEVASYAQPQKPVDASNTYQVTEGPNGTPCPPDSAHRSFRPKFSAGTLNPVAGSYSTFLFRLSREDQEQELSQVTSLLPPGLLAKIAGIPFCSAQTIASISTAPGAGAKELAHPACPAASQIGSVSAGLGAGPGPNYFGGKLYLAPPYKGAPLSLAIVAPALAGPFDLGNVVVRAALYVDPNSTQVRVVADPFPTTLQGVILRARDIRLRLDRPQTTINPTNCSPMSVGGQITGVGGDLLSTADDSFFATSVPFQVGSCASLPFKPKLALHLFGGTHRGSHPKFRAVLRMPKAGANIASASVALPESQFLDQSHIGTVCTRTQFAADSCPPASIYGKVTARTPLLDEALSGNVYLRSSNNPLPDMVLALRGKVDVNVVGRIDSVNAGIRTTFDFVPDAPLQTFTLTLAGGRKGLLVNSADVCKGSLRATAKFVGQNEGHLILHPKLSSACAKKPSRQTRRGAGR